MKFIPTPIVGAYRIELAKHTDDRGFFARLFCTETFATHGLPDRFVQINESHNAKAGTLRGFHYQLPPYADAKIVRPLHGALHDIILDLRPDSTSFGMHYGEKLDGDAGDMVFIPAGCAHAFVTLSDDVEIIYVVTAAHHPDSERGLRYDDPRFAVDWPITPTIISDKDRRWPNFDPQWHGIEQFRGLISQTSHEKGKNS